MCAARGAAIGTLLTKQVTLTHTCITGTCTNAPGGANCTIHLPSYTQDWIVLGSVGASAVLGVALLACLALIARRPSGKKGVCVRVCVCVCVCVCVKRTCEDHERAVPIGPCCFGFWLSIGVCMSLCCRQQC